MTLINADKYKKDIEHYRNAVCYQRNVTMDDCMRILDKQKDVLDKIRTEIGALAPKGTAEDVIDGNPIKEAVWETIYDVLQIIDKYRNEVSE